MRVGDFEKGREHREGTVAGACLLREPDLSQWRMVSRKVQWEGSVLASGRCSGRVGRGVRAEVLRKEQRRRPTATLRRSSCVLTQMQVKGNLLRAFANHSGGLSCCLKHLQPLEFVHDFFELIA